MLGLFFCALFIGWIIVTIFGAFGWFLWCEGWRKRRFLSLPFVVIFWGINLAAFAIYIRAMYHLFMLP